MGEVRVGTWHSDGSKTQTLEGIRIANDGHRNERRQDSKLCHRAAVEREESLAWLRYGPPHIIIIITTTTTKL